MSNRFADAIKTIVEPLIPKNSGDNSVVEKGTISGARGIGYMTANGVASSSGTPGVDQAPTITNPVTQGTSDAAKAATEAAAKALGEGANGSSQGSYDAAALLAGTAGPLPPGSAALMDAATLAALKETGISSYSVIGGSALLEVTGLKVCGENTDRTMIVRTDGLYHPPTGWTDSNTPPHDTGWSSGYYWTATNAYGGSYEGCSFYEVCQKVMYGSIGYINVSPSYSVTSCKYVSDTYTPGGASGDYLCRLYLVWAYPNAINTGWIDNTITATRHVCTAPSTPSAFCLLTQSTTSVVPWPATGSFIMSLNTDGQFAPSIRDTEVPTSYIPPRSKLKACTSGDVPVEFQTLANGGFAFYQTSGGAPTGTVQLYGPDKTLTGFTDGTNLANLLPK